MIDIAKEIQKMKENLVRVAVPVSPEQFIDLKSGNPSKETLDYFYWAAKRLGLLADVEDEK